MKKAIILKTGEVISIYDRTFDAIDFGRIFVAIDADNNIFAEEELHIIKDPQTFIEDYLPDYSQNEQVTLSDDIECCISGEGTELKLRNVITNCGKHVEDWEAAQIRIDRELLEEAAKNFISPKL